MVIAQVGDGEGCYANRLKADGCSRLSLVLPVGHQTHPFAWPLPDDSVEFLLSVNSLGSIADIGHFVKECARTSKTTHLVSIVTRSHDDLKADTFARYFPDTASEITATLPEVPVLEKLLQDQGLYCMRRAVIRGSIEVAGESAQRRSMLGVFGGPVRKDELERGMGNWEQAIKAGDNRWESQFTLLVTRKVRPWHATPLVSGAAM